MLTDTFPTLADYAEYFYKRGADPDYTDIVESWYRMFKERCKVGDGATIHYWSDAEAYTIIKKTPKTLVLRRCKATLSPDFKPEFILGGFSAHCTNQEEQTYIYEDNPDGEIIRVYWSEKEGRYKNGDLWVSPGRHKFYDYNF